MYRHVCGKSSEYVLHTLLAEVLLHGDIRTLSYARIKRAHDPSGRKIIEIVHGP